MNGLSFRHVWTVAVTDDPRVPADEKHLAVTLSLRWMNSDGGCHAAIETIAAKMGRSPRSVQRTLNKKPSPEICKLGYLVVTPGGGRANTHAFQATLPSETVTDRRPLDGERETSPTQRVTAARENGDRMSPELEEQLVEQLEGSVCTDDAHASSDRDEPEEVALLALQALVDDLEDADANTATTFRRQFSDLDAGDFHHAAEVVAKRRDGGRLVDEPLESDAAFAYSVLANRQYLRRWDEERPVHDAEEEPG